MGLSFSLLFLIVLVFLRVFSALYGLMALLLLVLPSEGGSASSSPCFPPPSSASDADAHFYTPPVPGCSGMLGLLSANLLTTECRGLATSWDSPCGCVYYVIHYLPRLLLWSSHPHFWESCAVSSSPSCPYCPVRFLHPLSSYIGRYLIGVSLSSLLFPPIWVWGNPPLSLLGAVCKYCVLLLGG